MSGVEKDEGARSFARFIENVSEGAAHAELSQTLHELVTKLVGEASHRSAGVKGSITLSLDLKVEPNGIVGVAWDVKKKEPKPSRPAAVMFVTRGMNLSVENPRQQKLPLRDVNSPREVREVVGRQEG